MSRVYQHCCSSSFLCLTMTLCSHNVDLCTLTKAQTSSLKHVTDRTTNSLHIQQKQMQHYLGGRSLCNCLHSPQHAESQLQVARAEGSGQVGGQVLHMVPCDAADGAEVGGHLFHHVTVAQASYL